MLDKQLLACMCKTYIHACHKPNICFLTSKEEVASKSDFFQISLGTIMLRVKWMTTMGNLFLLLKKQRLIIIEADLQNAQLHNNHMIPSNFEIEVKKGSTSKAGIMKIKKLLKMFESVLRESNAICFICFWREIVFSVWTNWTHRCLIQGL